MANGKAKILVVEDNVALAGVVCFNLVRAGFQTKAVASGEDAVNALREESFDLVLTDQQMPVMTGVQLCEHIRQIPAYKRTPIILLTAKCMEMSLPQLKEQLGISAALPKPFSPSELITCIEESLAAACNS